ncbi:GNAT family N-acetyltransferase [Spirosoma foliorum]|uniref:GNAT family N-acetyltransferase n=1 Tax=Spirosoma foliorum TaxID=2710596 RepID=A0A7G5GSR5_9BACT|nr:GNAT family N-acetyltransferase [Spirosoma foliorum]QMW01907.1 GNAT family N-acetyltransferase [Spirosoma foliorum]
MKHILDNPAWNALCSGNSQLSVGTETAKYFVAEVSPFAGIQENTPENFDHLHQIAPSDSAVILIADEPLTIPESWKILNRIDGFQMVYTKRIDPVPPTAPIVPLTEQHVPQMLALTKLTNPGPFSRRTIEFGHYEGIFEGDALVAMTGQRLHAFDFAEISAVCTHPDYLGKGYARQLILNQIYRIQANAGTPYLHVRSDNTRAIGVYEAMGFERRTEIYFYVLFKN